MALQIIKNNGATWHDIQSGVRLKIKQLTRSKMRELLLAADGDQDAYALAVADEVLQDWQGLVDEDGQPLELTRENKLAVAENALVGSVVERLSSGLRMVQESEVKN